MLGSTHRVRAWCAALAAVVLAASMIAASPRALAADPSAAPNPSDGAKSVVYVEVNSNDVGNVADYVLENTDRPAFDIAVIFAANINWSGSEARLHLNDRVSATLSDARHQIRPLQARGTKVLLSVLGNHQGAGIANFAGYAEADAFAAQLQGIVEANRLDGIDFDDEWAKYGTNGTPQPNDYSFLYLLKALRARLGPDKLITFYNIGPAMDSLEYDGENGAQYIDYAFNPYYGTWDPPRIPGLTKQQLAPGAIDLTQTSAARAASLAQRTVQEGYGALITYNLTAGDHAGYLSDITVPLKGRRTVKLGPDTTRPTIEILSPTTPGPFQKLDLRVRATDDRGVAEITCEEFRGGKRVTTTGTGIFGAMTGEHVMTLSRPAGDYTLSCRATDHAGNASVLATLPYTIDTTAPTATIKRGHRLTIAKGRHAYRVVSYQLKDAGGVDKVVINGVVTDVPNGERAAIERIRPGVHGAVRGRNTMVVHDVAGNTATYSFVLV